MYSIEFFRTLRVENQLFRALDVTNEFVSGVDSLPVVLMYP